MSGFDYGDLVGIASDLITDFGDTTNITLHHRAVTADVDQPWKVEDTSTSEVVPAVRVEIPLKEVDGENIQTGDVRYLLADQGLTSSPKPGDIVEDAGKFARVILAVPTQPGPTKIIHELTCRQ